MEVSFHLFLTAIDTHSANKAKMVKVFAVDADKH